MVPKKRKVYERFFKNRYQGGMQDRQLCCETGNKAGKKKVN